MEMREHDGMGRALVGGGIYLLALALFALMPALVGSDRIPAGSAPGSD